MKKGATFVVWTILTTFTVQLCLPAAALAGGRRNSKPARKKPAPRRAAPPKKKNYGRAPRAILGRTSRTSQKLMQKVHAKAQPRGIWAWRAPARGRQPARRPVTLTRRGPRPTIVGAVSGLGQLVPVANIVAKINAQVAAGKALPGDPLALEYERYLAAKAARELKPDSPIPGELAGDDKKKFQERYVGILIADLKDYAKFVGDHVFSRSDQRVGREDMADLMYQYGCRAISRLMPGFAKIVRKRISNQVDLVGDWDQEISKEALEKAEAKKPKGNQAGPKPYEPPQKDEVVEVCSVTHRQLEETLKRDLTLIANAMQVDQNPDEDEERLNPISGGPSWAPKLSALVTEELPSNLLGAPRRRPAPPPKKPAAKMAPARAAWLGNIFAKLAQRRPAPKPAPMSRAPRRFNFVRTAIFTPPPNFSSLLHTDLSKYDPRLGGETMHDLAKRLLSFYRKSGTTRNFIRAMRGSKADVARMAQNVQTSAPGDAKGELSNHTQKGAVDKRGQREVLRRRVEQWTYGYEYDRLASAMSSKVGRLVTDYKKAERSVLDEFWSDCSELQDICQGPKTHMEKATCEFCAVRAFETHCLDGKDSHGKCKGGAKVVSSSLSVPIINKPIPQQVRNTKDMPGGHTMKNWVVLSLIGEVNNPTFIKGWAASDPNRLKSTTVQNLVERRFLPNSTDQSEDINQDGKGYLDSLPITSWQRCTLFNPYYRHNAGVCDDQKGDMQSVKKIARGTIQWTDARLFRETLSQHEVGAAMSAVAARWKHMCNAKVTKTTKFLFWTVKKEVVPANDCRRMDQEARAAADKFLKRGNAADEMGQNRDGKMKDAGEAAAGAVGPIVGKLLGMLLKAAGLNETMKTLARAAGMNPEQSADCEDAEYRKDVMKLPKAQDNKRGCLLRVFAKNFTNVLESIIVMLGEKLVDWGVDLLRTALQAVKSALLSAAGSVPFAGGVLATIVDIGWELLMNYGAKMILKTFVVAKLPEWLKVHELAKLPIEKVMEHPIVQVVAGIILQLIDAAMIYGEKSWMAVGVDSVLNTIQIALQNSNQWFWVRAITFAKKELRSGASAQDLMGQVLEVARAMVGGFATALGRRLDADAREPFDNAVNEIKNLLTPAKISELKDKLLKDPVKALTSLIGEKIGPVVLPLIASLVPMPEFAKQLMLRIGTAVSDTVKEISERRFDAKVLVARVVDVVAPWGAQLVDKLPIGDAPLKKLVTDGYSGLVDLLKNPEELGSALQDPKRIAKGILSTLGDFVKARAGALIQDANLQADKDGIQEAVDTVVNAVASADPQQMLGSLRPAAERLVRVLRGMVPALQSEIAKALSYAPLSGLVQRLVEEVANLLADPAAFVALLKSGSQAVSKLLPLLGKVIGPFLREVVLEPLPPGVGRDVVGMIVDTARGFLDRPDTLKQLVQSARGDTKGFVKKALGAVIPLVLRAVPSQALQSVFQVGLDVVLNLALK